MKKFAIRLPGKRGLDPPKTAPLERQPSTTVPNDTNIQPPTPVVGPIDDSFSSEPGPSPLPEGAVEQERYDTAAKDKMHNRTCDIEKHLGTGISSFQLLLIREVLRSHEESGEFMNWLLGPSRSYQFVTRELAAVRKRRGASLRWALDLPELRTWQLSTRGTKENLLWFKGGPGIGKSTMMGYFIDYLLANIPRCNVLYVFCKRGTDGLTGPGDILRNLAYQFAINEQNVRSKLEKIKDCDLSPEHNSGLEQLFNITIRETLGEIKETFIVLDGMDEADWEMEDYVGNKPGMEILLDCLASLTKIRPVRLLMSTRPACGAAEYAEKGVVKDLEYGANDNDIRMYIDSVINDDRQKKLRERFEEKWIVHNDIVNGARGIFLWAVSLIEQLRRVTHSREDFSECLETFRKASGSPSLGKLWLTVLKMVKPEVVPWVKEILKWTVISRRNLGIDELRTAVELSRNRKLANFREFLKDHCSSFLRITESSPIQLTHDTLRSFLLTDVENWRLRRIICAKSL